MKNCIKCNTVNNDSVAFCIRCGQDFSSGSAGLQSGSMKSVPGYPTPSDQAAEFIKKTKEKTSVVSQNLQTVWAQKLLFPEKMTVVGAGVNIIAVFLLGLPLTPTIIGIILMFIVLGLIYFSQGSDLMKMGFARWHMIIGAPLLLLAIVTRYVMNELIGYFGMFATSNIPSGVQLGLWLVVAGSLLIVVGAYRLQGLLLNRRS